MTAIHSPLPGIFYHKPAPEEPAYKSDGDPVAIGDTIGLVEVMKTFIEVKADQAGTFSAYRVENAAAVQAGMVLAELMD